LSASLRSLQYRILVRDNSEASEIESLQKSISHLGAPVLYFSSPENPGFGSGHNLNFWEVEHGAQDVFLILNPDISLPDTEAIPKMLEHCTGMRIVSCVIETAANGKVWFSGGFFGKVTGEPTVSRARFSEPLRRTEFVTGCCLMISTALFRSLDGFDESYFMYSEDVDLSLRARELGADMVVVNRRILHSIGSGERGSYSDLYLYEGTKNRLRCLRQHKHGIYPIGLAYMLLKYSVIRSLQLAIRSRHPVRQVKAVWRGIFDGVLK
jgi:GT2 family glycosyltransferase